MSASLVGSEMCIRDSPNCPRSPLSNGLQAAASEGPSSGANRAGNGSRAVSYTHLTLPTICSV
eukprot:10097075-Alexandrium_andersonii.AAC.1